MNIGRNDLCFCGSGKKYKKCCMAKMQNPELAWKNNFDKLDINVEKKEELKIIMFDTYDFMKKNGWQGACHTISAIHYILLNELGVRSKLCIGTIVRGESRYDHSWIEINNKIYDVTIASGLNGINISQPIMAGINIETLKKTEVLYGVEDSLIYPASVIKNLNITEYLDGFDSDPEGGGIKSFAKDGIWNLILDFAKNINLELNIEDIREEYSKVKRTIV